MSCFNDWTERFDGGGGVKSASGKLIFLQGTDRKMSMPCDFLAIFAIKPIKNNFAVHDNGGKFSGFGEQKSAAHF